MYAQAETKFAHKLLKALFLPKNTPKFFTTFLEILGTVKWREA